MKYKTTAIYLSLPLIFILPFFVLPRVIKITKIECLTQYGLCSDDLTKNVNSVLGRPLIIAKRELKKILKNYALAQKYSIRFKLPSILRTDIILAKPKFAIGKGDGSKSVLVDKGGFVLEEVSETNLPRILISGELPGVGEKVKEDKFFALNLVYGIYYLYQVKVGEIDVDRLIVNFPNGVKVIFPLEGDRDTLLGSLKLVFAKAENVKEIDLRYKNPIIR